MRKPNKRPRHPKPKKPELPATPAPAPAAPAAGRASRFESIRWTISQASAEFGINPRTLVKNLKTAGIQPGLDQLFSTADMARAVYGDLELARIKLTNEQAENQRIKKEESLRQLAPIEMVLSVWQSVITDLRQKILNAAIPDQLKQEVLRDLQTIPVDDYFNLDRAEEDEKEEE